MDMSNKTSDKNVGSIEDDVKRCNELIKVEHANWIGISNQLAISHILAEREQKDKRIQELEEENHIQRKQLNDAFERGFIHKDKVKETLEYIEDYFDRLNGPDEDIDYIRQVKKELLEGEK